MNTISLPLCVVYVICSNVQSVVITSAESGGLGVQGLIMIVGGVRYI